MREPAIAIVRRGSDVCKTARRGRKWFAICVLLASLGGGTGCAFREPIDRSIVRSALMRFDYRTAYADLVGEEGGRFGGSVGIGGGCLT